VEAHAPEATGPPTLPSLPARIGLVFFSPGKLFEALRKDPAWVGALLVSAVMVGASSALIPAEVLIDAAREQIIAQGGEVPPGFDNMANLFRVTGAVGAVLFIFIWAFALAGIVTLVFNFLFGGEGRYKQYLSVVSHGILIGALGALLTVPLKIAQGDATVTLSLGTFAFFLEEGYPFRVLKLMDLFGLWGATVMAIGVTKIDPKRSLGVALTFFYGLSIAMALIFGIFGG